MVTTNLLFGLSGILPVVTYFLVMYAFKITPLENSFYLMQNILTTLGVYIIQMIFGHSMTHGQVLLNTAAITGAYGAMHYLPFFEMNEIIRMGKFVGGFKKEMLIDGVFYSLASIIIPFIFSIIKKFPLIGKHINYDNKIFMIITLVALLLFVYWNGTHHITYSNPPLVAEFKEELQKLPIAVRETLPVAIQITNENNLTKLQNDPTINQTNLYLVESLRNSLINASPKPIQEAIQLANKVPSKLFEKVTGINTDTTQEMKQLLNSQYMSLITNIIEGVIALNSTVRAQ